MFTSCGSCSPELGRLHWRATASYDTAHSAACHEIEEQQERSVASFIVRFKHSSRNQRVEMLKQLVKEQGLPSGFLQCSTVFAARRGAPRC